jgi:hypothetical protein
MEINRIVEKGKDNRTMFLETMEVLIGDTKLTKNIYKEYHPTSQY